MAASLNPYRAWLGVNSDAQPPNHYDLLGLSRFETAPPLIAQAFARQMAKVTPQLSGEHASLAQRVAGELANAKVELLTPTTKRLYDAELSRKVLAEQAATPAAPTAPATPAEPAWTEPLLPPTAGPAPAPQYPQSPQAPGYAPQQPAYGATPQYPAYPQYPTAPAGMPQGVPHTPAVGYAAPAMQATPYGHGQPYATASVAPTAPGQPMYAAPAQPQYAAAPQYGPAVDTVAPGYGSTQPSATSRYSGAARRRKPSSAPLVFGAAIALLIIAGAVWALRPDSKKTAKSTDARDSSDDSRVVEAPKPRDTSKFLANNASLRERPGSRRPSNKPTPSVPPKSKPDRNPPEPKVDRPADDMPADMPSEDMPADDMPAESMPDESMPEDKPEPATPEPGEPEMPEPSDDAAKPDVPAGEPADKTTPAQAAAIKKLLTLAHTALGKRDIEGAREQIDFATLEAATDSLEAEVARSELAAQYVKGFWDSVRSSLGTLQGAEELMIDDEIVNVVEVKKDSIIVRASGRNRTYTVEQMPHKLAFALADRWLDKKDSASPAFLGAFEAVDPKGDRAKARQLLQQAAKQGHDVADLLTYLDEYGR